MDKTPHGEQAPASEEARHPHAHAHPHQHEGTALSFGFWLTSLVLLVDVVQGVRSGSLALLSDALHVGTDLFSLALAWWAVRQASRPADAQKTFGYHRTTILAALANAVTLVAIVALIADEALGRLTHLHAIDPWQVYPAALLSILINLVIVSRLHGTHSHDVNIRSAALHVMGDVGASAGVVVGAAIIQFTGFLAADPIVSLGIACLVVWEAWKIIAETVNVLMEGVPPYLDVDTIVDAVKAVPGVKEVHDLHVWNIASNIGALSCHLVLDDRALSECRTVVETVEHLLTDRFRVGHTTLQLETESCGHALYCTITPSHSH